jgi:hypothetical protein
MRSQENQIINGGLLFRDRRFGKAEEKSGHQKKLSEILT